MMKKRIIVVGVIISIFIFALMGRLYNLSIVHKEEYTTKIQNQITQEVTIYYPRGKIVDRNGIPFTGRYKVEEGLVLPAHLEMNVLARHVIGQIQYQYKNNTESGIKGVSGLEKIFDQELNGGVPMKIIQYKDGWGQEISEEEYYVYGDHINQGDTIKLTLDYHIQRVMEEKMKEFAKVSMDKRNFAGLSVVVMDVSSGEILGMASLGDENNKAVQSYPLGSIFKTLVAAKALELEVVKLEEEFICDGTFLIEDQIKNCHKTEGHGKITFLEAFAQSCNGVFYEVATRLIEYNPNGTIKGNEVLQLAQDFGFAPYGEEKRDSFLLADKYSINSLPDSITGLMDVYNMALGQGKIEASPLMTTKIMATIANNGIMQEPLLVKERVNQEGKTIQRFEKKQEERVINEEINQQVRLLLEEVAKSGTGQGWNHQVTGEIAGKTSTAQNGKVSTHGWFSGYFPTEQPKYAMTVFVQEGGSGSGVAVPLFREIAEEINKLGQRK